jgi:hypothetical protein
MKIKLDTDRVAVSSNSIHLILTQVFKPYLYSYTRIDFSEECHELSFREGSFSDMLMNLRYDLINLGISGGCDHVGEIQMHIDNVHEIMIMVYRFFHNSNNTGE